MKYIVEIEMKRKHCLDCPLLDNKTGECKMQLDEEFDTWSEQMENCPLEEVLE